MPANTDPIYSRQADIQSTTQTATTLIGPTANTATDGTGTIYSVFVADATNGGFVQKIAIQPIASPAGTVLRVFWADTTATVTSGALVSNTSLNCHLLTEITLPAVTVSQTTAAPHFEIPLNFPLPASFKIGVTCGTASGASTNGWSVTVIGGKY